MDIFSRFLYQKNQYKKDPPRVLATAFPISNGQVSTYQTDGLDDLSIWDLGKSLNPTRTVHGRGELMREDIESIELAIEVSEPPLLHRNIIGWPTDEPEQLSKQMLFANKAKLILC